MKIKKGDNVIVKTGTAKGTTGKVLRALPKKDLVVVEGVNMKKKRSKSAVRGQKGERVSMAFPIHVSNVRLVKEEKKK